MRRAPPGRRQLISEGRARSRRLPRDDMEDVPVLGLAAGRDAVALLLVEELDAEAVQQAVQLGARDMRQARSPCPAVTLAIELPRKPPAGAQPGANPLP